MKQLIKQFEAISDWPEIIKDSFYRMFPDPEQIAEENNKLARKYMEKRPNLSQRATLVKI